MQQGFYDKFYEMVFVKWQEILYLFHRQFIAVFNIKRNFQIG